MITSSYPYAHAPPPPITYTRPPLPITYTPLPNTYIPPPGTFAPPPNTYTPPPINHPARPYQTTPGGLVHPTPSRRTRAKHGPIKAEKASYGYTYDVDTARPKFGEQAGIKQAGSTYSLRRDDGTPTPPRWTGIPAGLGETPRADLKRRRAHVQSPSPVTERHENDRPTFARPTPSGEILNAAAQTAEVNKQLEQQRKHRKDYLNDVWQRPHEPPVQPNRPETAEGTASPSSQIMTPAMMQQQLTAQQAFMHRQQEQAMLAHQQGGLVSQEPLENLNPEQAKQLQAMRDGQKGPFVGLPPHSMQRDTRQTSVDGSPNIPVQSKGMQHVHPGMDGPTSSFPHPSNFNGQQMTPVQMEAVRDGRMQGNYWRGGPQPGMMSPGDGYSYTDPASMYRDTEPAWRRPRAGSLERDSRPTSMIADRSQDIDGPKAPEVNGFPRAQKETMRKLSTQQTTPADVSSGSARTQRIDESDSRSPAIANDRTLCSGYRSFRGDLKYTISEDRTTDACKRRKAQFMALGQPLNRPAKVEPVTSRGAQITAREQREDGFENIEETSNRSDEYIPSDNDLGQRNIEVYAKSLARQHRIAMRDTSTVQDVDSGVSIDNSDHPPRSLFTQQKAGKNQLRNRASDRHTSRELSQRADYLREQLSNPALRATGPPGYSHDHRYNPVGHLHRRTDAVPMQRPPRFLSKLQDTTPENRDPRKLLEEMHRLRSIVKA